MTTKIEWVRNPDGTPGETWNPTSGCTRVSEGCRHCYAERFAWRLAGRSGYPKDNPFQVTLHPERLGEPLKWKKPRRVFVNSMSDLFHPDVSDEYITKVFNVMDKAAAYHGHTFMVLTKRAERMKDFVNYWWKKFEKETHLQPEMKHIWLGVSCENQQAADERIPLLLQTPAAVRFISVEPMLGPVDLEPYMWLTGASTCGPWQDCLGRKRGGGGVGGQMVSSKPSRDIAWIICGCETGPGARPMQIDWARGLRDQCLETGVLFFFKQMTDQGKVIKMPELDGGIWSEIPGVTSSDAD